MERAKVIPFWDIARRAITIEVLLVTRGVVDQTFMYY